MIRAQTHNTNIDSENQTNICKNASIDNLKIISLNCQSINNKKEVFWEMLDSHSPDVIVACETWLETMKLFQLITNYIVVTVMMGMVVSSLL